MSKYSAKAQPLIKSELEAELDRQMNVIKNTHKVRYRSEIAIISPKMAKELRQMEIDYFNSFTEEKDEA